MPPLPPEFRQRRWVQRCPRMRSNSESGSAFGLETTCATMLFEGAETGGSSERRTNSTSCLSASAEAAFPRVAPAPSGAKTLEPDGTAPTAAASVGCSRQSSRIPARQGGRSSLAILTPASIAALTALKLMVAAKGCVASARTSTRRCLSAEASPSMPPNPPLTTGTG